MMVDCSFQNARSHNLTLFFNKYRLVWLLALLLLQGCAQAPKEVHSDLDEGSHRGSNYIKIIEDWHSWLVKKIPANTPLPVIVVIEDDDTGPFTREKLIGLLGCNCVNFLNSDTDGRMDYRYMGRMDMFNAMCIDYHFRYADEESAVIDCGTSSALSIYEHCLLSRFLSKGDSEECRNYRTFDSEFYQEGFLTTFEFDNKPEPKYDEAFAKEMGVPSRRRTNFDRFFNVDDMVFVNPRPCNEKDFFCQMANSPGVINLDLLRMPVTLEALINYPFARDLLKSGDPNLSLPESMKNPTNSLGGRA